DSRGDVWAGLDRTNQIYRYPFTGFDGNGKPTWGPGVTFSIPQSIRPLTRIEVYHGWLAGNNKRPDPVINLTSVNPKSITAAGNYLFVGYVHTVPNIDAFNLTTGHLDTTLINANPTAVYVGNDVDSMYGLRAYLTSSGEYVVTKD